MEEGLLPQTISFQTSRSSGCKQHLGSNLCQKNNSSRFHHGSVKEKFRLLLLPNKPKTLFHKSIRYLPEPKKGYFLIAILKLYKCQLKDTWVFLNFFLRTFRSSTGEVRRRCNDTTKGNRAKLNKAINCFMITYRKPNASAWHGITSGSHSF